MNPLVTLFDRQMPGEPPWLPDELRRIYDGDLRFTLQAGRPTVIANFVSSLDGVVSLGIRGRSGGGEISGGDSADHLIMGILRAAADALMIGAGTLHGDPGKVRIAENISPDHAQQFAAWRKERGLAPLPINVVVSGSGHIDIGEPTFHTAALPTIILTSTAGLQRLREEHGQKLAVADVRAVGDRMVLDPADILRVLHGEFGVELLLHEGGPTLLGEFLHARLIDELFLTIAPQLAGRSKRSRRLGLVENIEIAPEASSWWRVLSEKAAGDYRYFRLAPR